MNGYGRLVGELTQGVLFEEAQSVGKDGDGRQRVGSVGGGNQSAPAQLFLMMEGHFEFVKVEPLACLPGR